MGPADISDAEYRVVWNLVMNWQKNVGKIYAITIKENTKQYHQNLRV